jgi:hypothetical protein
VKTRGFCRRSLKIINTITVTFFLWNFGQRVSPKTSVCTLFVVGKNKGKNETLNTTWKFMKHFVLHKKVKNKSIL